MEIEKKSTRDGLGDSLLELGENPDIVVLSADLTESVRVDKFAKKFPNRFIQTGIAEQNMASIAAGLSLCNKIPFITSHAAFSPSRNWDQIRVSICMSGENGANVKIASTHSGFSNAPDGQTAEALEDIALMRVLPKMTVISPIDYYQTIKAVSEAVKYKGPVYIRLSKTDTECITSEKDDFQIGKTYVLRKGSAITVLCTGVITAEVLKAMEMLDKDIELIACPTIKPLDAETILKSISKTGKVLTVEEHQLSGGFGSAVLEMLNEHKVPMTITRLGVNDAFGVSGSYEDLLQKFCLDSKSIAEKIKAL